MPDIKGMLEESLALEGARGDYRAVTDPRYKNLVGPYGGWTAAMLLRSVLKTCESGFAPLAATYNFMGPIADGDISVTAKQSRANRSTAFWHARMSQADEASAEAIITLGARRETEPFSRAVMPDVAPPSAARPLMRPPSAPGWMRAYDIAHLTTPAFEGKSSGHSLTWVKDHSSPVMTWESLTALADSMLPRLFYMRGAFSPISTISLNIYYHAHADDLAAVGNDHVLIESDARRGGNGYYDQVSTLWSSKGALLATTEQLVWYK